MTAKEYLSQAFKLNKLIKSELNDLENYKNLAMGVTSGCCNERVMSSGSAEGPFERYTATVIDLERQIENDKHRLVEMIYELSQDINKLVCIQDRIVLRNRYLLFMTWDEIALQMHYTRRWVFSLHKQALQDFEIIMRDKLNGLS